MKLRKDNAMIELSNEVHISAFLNSGWVEVVGEESPSADQAKKVGRQRKTDDYSEME